MIADATQVVELSNMDTALAQYYVDASKAYLSYVDQMRSIITLSLEDGPNKDSMLDITVIAREHGVIVLKLSKASMLSVKVPSFVKAFNSD